MCERENKSLENKVHHPFVYILILSFSDWKGFASLATTVTCLSNNTSLLVHCHLLYLIQDVTSTLPQCWPGISGADPALNKRVVNSHFCNRYYVSKVEVVYAYRLTCDNYNQWMRGVLAFTVSKLLSRKR